MAGPPGKSFTAQAAVLAQAAMNNTPEVNFCKRLFFITLIASIFLSSGLQIGQTLT